jgi:hypothetical protein
VKSYKRAFPVRNRWDPGNEDFDLDDPGMTLRDWFAGQALAGLSKTDCFINKDVAEHIAKQCYTLADTMLLVRENSGKENESS